MKNEEEDMRTSEIQLRDVPGVEHQQLTRKEHLLEAHSDGTTAPSRVRRKAISIQTPQVQSAGHSLALAY